MQTAATSILDDVGVALVEKLKSVSLRNNFRLESERFVGAGLELEDQVILFSLFGSENGNGSSTESKMRKASARRESHAG